MTRAQCFVEGAGIPFFSIVPRLFQGPFSLLSKGYRGIFLQRLRMFRALPSLTYYIVILWCSITSRDCFFISHLFFTSHWDTFNNTVGVYFRYQANCCHSTLKLYFIILLQVLATEASRRLSAICMIHYIHLTQRLSNFSQCCKHNQTFWTPVKYRGHLVASWKVTSSITTVASSTVKI